MYKYLLFPDFKDKAVTLSYDDGVVFDKRLIEIMQAHGLKGTFNINSGMFAEKEGEWRLTKEAALKLYTESDMEVAVHGVMHYSLTEVDAAIATRDVLQDRVNLEAMFGKVVKGMAYANGAYDDAVVETLKKCGINYSRTVTSTHSFDIPSDWLRLPATCHHNDPKLNELVDAFLQDEPVWYRKRSKLFYLWGHSYEFNNNDNWEVIENFAKRIGGRQDVWYATNGEIYDYVKAYARLQFSVEETYVHNPSAIDVYIRTTNDKNVLVPAGKTVCLKSE